MLPNWTIFYQQMSTKTSLVKKNRYHIPWVLWTLIILVLSITPGDQLPDLTLDWISPDTLAHLIMYTILSWFLLLGFGIREKKMNRSDIRVYRGVIIAGIFLGTLIEIAQGTLIYRRHFDVADIVANLFGTIFGSITFKWTARKIGVINR